jgi:CheY-like chemotaxis protein
MPEERQEALAAGVNDFLPKPMELERMATVIRSYCPLEAERSD